MLKTVEAFISAYGRRSLDEVLACMAEGAGVMAYGTSLGEKRLGLNAVRAQLLADWADTTAGTMKITWHHEAGQGDMGWVAADLAFHFESSAGIEERTGRASFVLGKDSAGRWRIQHMHFSLPSDFAPGGH